MKKYLFPIVVVAGLTLSACGGGSDDADTSSAESTVEETTVEEIAAEEAEGEETPAVSDEEVETWAKSVIGIGPETSWQEAAAQGAPSWAYAVNSVTYGKGGNVVFNMQLDRTSDKDIAESITKLYANSIRFSSPEFADDISYIIVENGVGEHMKQERI